MRAIKLPLICLLLCVEARLSFAADAASSDAYQHVPTANLRDVSNQNSVVLSPSQMRRTFGDATPELWDTESVGAYYFVSRKNEVFIVYYRAYDQSSSKIEALRKSFWEKKDPIELSIGAVKEDGVDDFVTWLRSKLKGN